MTHGAWELWIQSAAYRPAGVECRSGGLGGDHTVVVTFANNVVSGNANVASGLGSVAGSPTFSGNTMTVNLTGVGDAQTIALNLSNVTDEFSQVLANTALNASFLLGDTNGDRIGQRGRRAADTQPRRSGHQTRRTSAPM